ncbi:MAG: branched-chain amino acid aminotransferase [Paracoccaceae bacterium]|jgi:branched-chain amino acid aminotransferase
MKGSMTVSWNGELVESGKIEVPLSDATYLRGEGVFETMRAENWRVCHWQDHYERLTGAAQAFGFEVPMEDELEGCVSEVLQANDLDQARVRITLGLNCLVTAEALSGSMERPRVVTSECPVNELSPLAGIKCTSYAENMLLLRGSGVDEVIRPNLKGELCEGCISNVFFVRNGEIFTPALETGCLPGVMRRNVLRQVKIEEGQWPLSVLREAEEIWLSNATRKLMAVAEIDGRLLRSPSEMFAQIVSRI